MKNLIYIITLICFFSVSNEIYADNDPAANATLHPSVIPPSPTAGELGKYGNIPVSLATGTPNISIPLYAISSKEINLPIYLSYNSNGIKVDQVASWVGMGWSLNAGGVITRTIRGGDDETSHSYKVPDNLDIYCYGTYWFLRNCWADTTDTEPDIFNYNFDGYSGKFIIDPNNFAKIYSIPYNNLKIEINFDTINYVGLKSFIITTPEGVKYLFGDEYIETTREILLGCAECVINRTQKRNMKTAWYLKRIDYPTGEYINFYYDSNLLNYYSGIRQTIRRLVYESYSECECELGSEGVCEEKLRNGTLHLKAISSSAKDSIAFSSSKGRLDLNDYKLDSISIFNSNMIGF